MLEFLLGFILALLTGNVSVSEGSAIDSQSPTVYHQIALTWQRDDDETMFIILDSAGVHTGP